MCRTHRKMQPRLETNCAVFFPVCKLRAKAGPPLGAAADHLRTLCESVGCSSKQAAMRIRTFTLLRKAESAPGGNYQ